MARSARRLRGDAHRRIDARPLEAPPDPCLEGGCVLVVEVDDEDGEFVPTQAGHDVGAPEKAGEHGGGPADEQVASEVALLVVGALQPVEVDHRHRRPCLAPVGASLLPVHRIVPAPPVVQPRQVVPMSGVLGVTSGRARPWRRELADDDGVIGHRKRLQGEPGLRGWLGAVALLNDRHHLALDVDERDVAVRRKLALPDVGDDAPPATRPLDHLLDRLEQPTQRAGADPLVDRSELRRSRPSCGIRPVSNAHQ